MTVVLIFGTGGNAGECWSSFIRFFELGSRIGPVAVILCFEPICALCIKSGREIPCVFNSGWFWNYIKKYFHDNEEETRIIIKKMIFSCHWRRDKKWSKKNVRLDVFVVSYVRRALIDRNHPFVHASNIEGCIRNDDEWRIRVWWNRPHYPFVYFALVEFEESLWDVYVSFASNYSIDSVGNFLRSPMSNHRLDLHSLRVQFSMHSFLPYNAIVLFPRLQMLIST